MEKGKWRQSFSPHEMLSHKGTKNTQKHKEMTTKYTKTRK